MNIQVCRDTSDAVALYLPQRLYLKSFAKLNISVQLPSLKVHGKAISNWELMEKLRKMIHPEIFSVLKVSKNTTEIIRFDAELENRNKLERVLCRLDDRVIQLNDYPEVLRVRVSEAKSDFPSRHGWDSFFRDATDMDEMKPGERPDTVHISNLPIRWFVSSRDKVEDSMPSESLVKKIFEKFGNIRQVDVPAADPFRMQMKTAMRGITTPPQDSALYFEGYIQFSEYVGFVRCMDALRGRKLLRKQDDAAEWCGIHVDFDKTKHMTDAAVKRRSIVRERLLARQRAKEYEEQQEKEKLAKCELKERQKQERAERDKLEKMREREERRKKKQLAKLMARDGVDINSHVVEEEKKLLKAQRKLQAIRLIEELFKRIELRRESERGMDPKRTCEATTRERLVLNYKREQETRVEKQRERLRRASDGRIVIRSALETKKQKSRASSISSISSEEEHKQKKIKIEKNMLDGEADYAKAAASVFGLPAAYGYGYPFPAPHPAYPYQQSMYYPIRGAFYQPPAEYAPRGRGFGRRGRGRAPHRGHAHGPRLPNLEEYYRFVKKFDGEGRIDHDDRDRDRGRERSRSRRRSYTRSRSRSRSRSRRRSRSRSRRRSYSRSRSHSRTRRSRSRSRSRSRRSRSRRSRSHVSRSRSRSRGKCSRSRSRRRSTSKSRSKKRGGSKERRASVGGSKFISPNRTRKERSKSWSLPKEGEREWSKSPKNGV